MKRYTVLIAFAMSCLSVWGQGTAITATFTGMNNGSYGPFDSVVVKNLTRGCDTVCRYPDTLLMLGYLGIGNGGKHTQGFHLYQNVPNPVQSEATIDLSIPLPGTVTMTLTDLAGRSVYSREFALQKGISQLRLKGTGGIPLICSARYGSEHRSIRIIPEGRGLQRASLEFAGQISSDVDVKSSSVIQAFSYVPGDQLLLIGCHDTLEAGISDAPDASRLYTFEFAYHIPCPGNPSVTYEGIIYPTVQIFNQCWLAANLNVGTMIPRGDTSRNNGIIEKYCYDDNEDSCTLYGGFYQWDEMMAYTNVPGSKGICPEGWHIPTDLEWKILYGAADSLYRIGNSVWDSAGAYGVTVGFNLKGPQYWQNDGNGSDVFGFTIPPCGYRDYWGYIYGFGHAAKFWSAGEYDSSDAWSRGFGCHGRDATRYHESKLNGFSVRCLKD